VTTAEPAVVDDVTVGRDGVRRRSALITGGTRGIGLAVAEQLAGQDFDLTLTGRDSDRLARVAERLDSEYPQAVVAHHPADLGDLDAIEAVVRCHAEAHDGALDVLVLNAGAGTLGTLGTITMSRYQTFMDLNLRAPLHYLQAALPLLQRAADLDVKHGARVIAMSSIAGVYATAAHGLYGASKAALASVIDTLNAEQTTHGILGTVLAPASVDTDMTAWNHDVMPPDHMIPADDIAEVVASLVSLSRRTTIERIVLARSGTDGRRP
jgi:3-oxoacyl-[acyl-carrier protein] reductase